MSYRGTEHEVAPQKQHFFKTPHTRLDNNSRTVDAIYANPPLTESIADLSGTIKTDVILNADKCGDQKLINKENGPNYLKFNLDAQNGRFSFGLQTEQPHTLTSWSSVGQRAGVADATPPSQLLHGC